MNQQLALAIHLVHHANLHDFLFQDQDILKHVIEKSMAQIGDKIIFLWGAKASGKSHLLQGITQTAQERGLQALYIPMQEIIALDPDCLKDITHADIIAIDDVETIAGNSAWEEAFFHFYNQIRDQDRTVLYMASQLSPAGIPIQLPDLRSRLLWSLGIEIKELDDQGKVEVLQQQAQKRGFQLPEPVALYIIKRHTRSMAALQTLLNQLDHASLAAQRKITIPFVKSLLNL